MTCYSLIGLIPQPPGKIHAGSAIFDGNDLLQSSEKQLRSVRGKRISMIFQDPMTSLNPYLKISDQLTEPLKIHEGIKGKEALHKAIDALDEVGIPDPEKRIQSYPHEFSGGQRQRICIARALALNPKFIICDESVSALDVSVQAQVLNLLNELKADFNFTYIFISHDLSVVKFMSDRMIVMRDGKIKEIGIADEIYANPKTDYTKELIKAIPKGEIEDIKTSILKKEKNAAVNT